MKDLENEFRALDAVNRKAIMDLAKEVGNHVPFVGRTKNAKYDVTDKAQIGETLSISGSTPAPVPPTTPAPVPPTTPAPVPPKSPQEFYDEKLKQADTYLKKN